jgi:hypothetical protein
MRKKEDRMIDLTSILGDYEDKWVVLTKDEKEVIASGDSLEEIEKWVQKGIVMRVPTFNGSLTPNSRHS